MQAQNENLKDTVEEFMTQIRQYKQACDLSETRYSFLERDMQFQKECFEDEIKQLRSALTKTFVTLAAIKSQHKSDQLDFSSSSNKKFSFSPEKKVTEPSADH